MTRFPIFLAVVLAIAGSVSIAERDASACGVKLAIKTFRQHQRAKQTPVNTSDDRPVLAQRQARVPIAVGPPQPEPRRVVDAKHNEPAHTAVAEPPPVPPAPVPTVILPRPRPTAEKIAVVEKVSEVAASAGPHGALHNEVYFKVSSVELGNKTQLDKAAAWLAKNPDVHAVVEGYADPTGSADANMVLSQGRAEAARNYLVSAGIDTMRLEVIPYGDTRLKYGRNDGRNRHVAIEVKK